MKDIGFVSPHRVFQAAVVAILLVATYEYGSPEIRFEMDRLLVLPAQSVAWRLRLPFEAAASRFGWTLNAQANASVDQPEVGQTK